MQDGISHYEYEDEVADALRDMPEDYSIPIIVLLESNIHLLPKVEGYTQMISGVLRYEEPYFFEIEYINQPNEFPIFIDINPIKVDRYLDYINSNQILKANESILQRIYKS
tara:strand:+ start:9086 stop:9418 length:333 start_codon:yes stop_codon:yes gene_type:complete